MILTTTEELAKYCAEWAKSPFITVDTEFLRDKTYWPILCLIQVGWHGGAVAIDPLNKDMNLAPFFEVMRNKNVIKVFHAARQDIEIFFKLSGEIPTPLVDTQVAAMVCGFGEQVSYETLVNKLAGKTLDKSLRFTDWSIRPLSAGHLQYALGDVTHLLEIYQKLREQAEKNGRWGWINEEMQELTNPALYQVDPENMWLRIRARSHKPKFLNLLRALASWREIKAQQRDIPRNRVLKDDGILEIASYPPSEMADFSRFRQIGGMSNKDKEEVIGVLAAALQIPQDKWPQPEQQRPLTQAQAALLELLRVLLRIKSEENQVAAKLIATSDELDQIARREDEACHALHGWRKEVFGESAMQLREGKLALSVDKKGLKLLPLST